MWTSSRRRALARPGPGDRLAGRLVDRLDVVVLDPHAGHAVRRGPVRVGRDRGRRRPRHRDRPVVVLDDEDDRQPPQRGQVQRLVERALVGGALAGDRDGDPVGALALERERLAAAPAGSPRR